MTPCREWRGDRSWNGYGRKRLFDGVPTLNKDGTPRKGGEKGRYVGRIAVHRWVWEQINGPIPEGKQIMHICDNRLCYRYDHLELGTAAENIADKVAKGRQARGIKHWAAKLTDDQVREIYASTEPGVELASMYDVSEMSISSIRTGRTWTHITQESRV